MESRTKSVEERIPALNGPGQSRRDPHYLATPSSGLAGLRQPCKTIQVELAQIKELSILCGQAVLDILSQTRDRRKQRATIDTTNGETSFMKRTICAIVGLTGWAASSALAADQIQGRLLELHSCEVFAGPCIISSEGTLGGRQSLQIWEFKQGSWQGADFAGLKVAVLESGKENLAIRNAKADRAVIYLPEQATLAQRRALTDYLHSHYAQLASAKTESRIVPISLTDAADGLTFQVGQFASGKAVRLTDCDTQTCGSELWYEPGMPTSVFTVARNAGSKVNEPLLSLKWSDFGRRSVFIARFGTTAKAQNLFVQSKEWCGAGGLF